MPEAPASLLHYVSLDGAGGVELQFVEFLTRARFLTGCRSSVVACGTQLHPLIRTRLADTETVAREKMIGALKLPKRPRFLRAAWQRRQVRIADPAAVLIWNRLRDSQNTLSAAGPDRCIYWERGAAWFSGDTPAKRGFLENVRAVLCNSRAAKRMLELRWGYRGNIEVVPNALRHSLLPSESPIRGGCSRAACWRLGVAARLQSIKGVAVVLHTVAELARRGTRVTLEIAGDGPMRDELGALAQRLGITSRVRFLGLVSDMRAFYSRIDLLVHPALREPFGQIVIEAAAYGVPSVVTGVDGLVEVVSSGQTGDIVAPTLDLAAYRELGVTTNGLPPFVYDPVNDVIDQPKAVDPVVLADAVVGLLADDERYVAYSRSGLERVDRDYSFDRHVLHVLAAIDYFIRTGTLTGGQG